MRSIDPKISNEFFNHENKALDEIMKFENWNNLDYNELLEKITPIAEKWLTASQLNSQVLAEELARDFIDRV